MRLIAITMTMALVGCASAPELTESGESVRIVSTSPQGCKYLGQVEIARTGQVYQSPSDRDKAYRNKLKNKAGSMGADTLEVLTLTSGEAYVCD